MGHSPLHSRSAFAGRAKTFASVLFLPLLLLCCASAARADTVTFSAGMNLTSVGTSPDAGCGSGVRDNYRGEGSLTLSAGPYSNVTLPITSTFSFCGRQGGSLTVPPNSLMTLTAADGSIHGTLALREYQYFTSEGREFLEAYAVFSITGGTGTYADATGLGYLGSIFILSGAGAGTGNLGLTSGTLSAPGLTLPQPVPEPATMILFATGLAGVAAKVRRRRKA